MKRLILAVVLVGLLASPVLAQWASPTYGWVISPQGSYYYYSYTPTYPYYQPQPMYQPYYPAYQPTYYYWYYYW